MPAVIVNLASVPPVAPVPGLATGGTSAAGVTTNGSTPTNASVPLNSSGVPASSNALPSNTPVVLALPATGPLAVINQYVLFGGKPYIYTAGINGGADYWKLDVTASPSITDVWANLHLYPAANYSVGTVFVASDRQVAYAVQFVNGANAWIYYNGIFEDVLANIPHDLDQTSIGMIFRASDYLHNWLWTGSAWSLTAAAQIGFQGGLPPGTTVFANPGPPFGGTSQLWQLCDGSTVGVSQEDATIVNTAVPTITDTWFVR